MLDLCKLDRRISVIGGFFYFYFLMTLECDNSISVFHLMGSGLFVMLFLMMVKVLDAFSAIFFPSLPHGAGFSAQMF